MALEPIEPDTAVELYLSDRQNELADATVSAQRSRLDFFVKWCEQNEIANPNDLTGRRLHEYRLWRRDEYDLALPTEKSQMDTLRVFIRWLETVDGVEPDLHQKVRVPSLTPEENSKDVMLSNEQAEDILEWLGRYQYASPEHVTITLLWHTMMRMGAAHALDVEDYDPEGQFLEVVHRPETDTQLKNGKHGERTVALSEQVCEILDHWIHDQRHDVTDDYGREPLLTSAQGRLGKSTIRKYVYRCTRPCYYGQDCPHDRDPDECNAATGYSYASECPSNMSPHAIRRGSITHFLSSDVPETAVSDRANVSSDVLDQHYDRRTEREKMEQRRKYLDDI